MTVHLAPRSSPTTLPRRLLLASSAAARRWRTALPDRWRHRPALTAAACLMIGTARCPAAMRRWTTLKRHVVALMTRAVRQPRRQHSLSALCSVTTVVLPLTAGSVVPAAVLPRRRIVAVKYPGRMMAVVGASAAVVAARTSAARATVGAPLTRQVVTAAWWALATLRAAPSVGAVPARIRIAPPARSAFWSPATSACCAETTAPSPAA